MRSWLAGVYGIVLAAALAGCGTTYQGLPIMVRSIIVPCPMTQYDAIAWSPDGTSIAYSAAINGSYYQLFTVSPDGGWPRQITTLGGFIRRVQWSQDSKEMAYMAGNEPSLVVVSLDGTQTIIASSVTDFAWSPDSRSIAYSAFTPGKSLNGDVYVTRLDGSASVRLTDDPQADGGVAWSPDGAWIAYHHQVDSNHQIFIMRSDGGQKRQLTFAGENLSARWSPDGSKISYYSTRNGRIEIYLISADGVDEKRVSSHYRYGEYVWLPDSRHIALSALDNNGDAYLTVVSIDTLAEESLTTLATTGTDDPAFSFSPDGKRVAFIDFDHSNPNVAAPEIYVINRDGSGKTRLTDNPGKRYCLNWPF